MKLYVASSWRNPHQQDVVKHLRSIGHEVYDFRNPKPGDNGFHWSEIDPHWKRWSPREFASALSHPIAKDGFGSDFGAMEEADGCVLLLPSGRSAHIEAGWFCGKGRPVWILVPHGGHSYTEAACSVCGDLDGCHGGVEPELMYAMASGGVFENLGELCESVGLADAALYESRNCNCQGGYGVCEIHGTNVGSAGRTD